MAKFKLTTEHLYWWPVTVFLPNPDAKRAGEVISQSFKMQFLSMSLDDARAMAAEIAALPAEERDRRQHEELERVSRDWNEDVVDDDNLPIPFSLEKLRAAMQAPWFRIGLYQAYVKSLSGEAARKGN